MGAAAMKSLGKSLGVNDCDLGLGKSFLAMTSPAPATNGRDNRWVGHHRSSRLCLKGAVTKLKRQHRTGGNICNPTPDKGL